jgi:MFS family permease
MTPTPIPATPAAGPIPATTGRKALVLAMLLIVYTFNFVDRQILGILAGPIQAELHLSDTQLGVLGGLAFAILYSTLAVPLAWLADRTSRTWVIAGSLGIWSAFTALCGVATGFVQLCACRLGVGVGEAGGVAPSYALIGDTFPPQQRARALAIYSLGIPLGSALGVLFGGYIAATVNWRAAFLSIGIAGLLFAPLFKLLVREPKRHDPAGSPKPRFMDVVRILAAKRSFWLLAFGAASSSMMGYGLGFWLPSLLRRSFGLDLIEASRFFGALALTGGVAGIILGGWLGDWLGARDRAAFARVPTIAYVICVPLYAAAMLAPSVWLSFALFVVPQALAYVWLGPVITAVQHLVPAPMRATASASFLLINNLIGVGLGALSIGALSDRLMPDFGDDALRVALLISLAYYLMAALFMGLAAKHLRTEWVE